MVILGLVGFFDRLGHQPWHRRLGAASKRKGATTPWKRQTVATETSCHEGVVLMLEGALPARDSPSMEQ